MALVYKINTAKIRKNELVFDDKNGFLIVPIYFMRTGVLFYRDWTTGEIIPEYVSESELFNPVSMASANGVIFTDGHPPDMIYPDNWSKYIKGSVHSVERENEYIAGKITVYDTETIRSIQAEEKDQISAGYWTYRVVNPGNFEGIAYNHTQTKIFYNHISRVWFGRAGEDLRMKKNARKNDIDYPVDFQIIDANNIKKDFVKNEGIFKVMIFKRKNGVSRDIKLPEADELFLQEVQKETEAELEAKTNDAEGLKKQLSSIQAELDLTKKKLNEVETKDFKSEFKARINLEDSVRPILGDSFDYDKASDIELKRNYLDKVYPEMKMNEKDDNYIISSFDFHQKTKKNDEPDQERYNESDRSFDKTRENIFKDKKSLNTTDSILDSVFESINKK